MKRVFYFCVPLFLMLVSSCSKDNSNARLEIKLTDAPGDYEEVNIDIAGVEVNNADGSNSGWKSVNIDPGVYDLLTLSNGLDTLLGSVELPAGRVSQIRLILGDQNSLKVAGQSVNLSTPSAQQSGLKLNVQADLLEGITYSITLDFDAARSIVHKGNNTYSLKPVIRALNEATSGAIRGEVAPAASSPAIYAVTSSGDTLATTYADDAGKFLLRAVEPGTYTVKFAPKAGYLATSKENVEVTLGNVTDVGAVEIQQ